LKERTNVLPLVAKKTVVTAAASVSSTKVFPTAGLALQLEVASILRLKVGEECWNSGLDGRLEAASIPRPKVSEECWNSGLDG
jgi:hypothetical protein